MKGVPHMDNDAFKKMMDDELKRVAAKVTLDEIKANIDTYTNVSEGCAVILKAWYDGMIKEGFDATQAMYLVGVIGSTMISVSLIAPQEGGNGHER